MHFVTIQSTKVLCGVDKRRTRSTRQLDLVTCPDCRAVVDQKLAEAALEALKHEMRALSASEPFRADSNSPKLPAPPREPPVTFAERGANLPSERP